MKKTILLQITYVLPITGVIMNDYPTKSYALKDKNIYRLTQEERLRILSDPILSKKFTDLLYDLAHLDNQAGYLPYLLILALSIRFKVDNPQIVFNEHISITPGDNQVKQEYHVLRFLEKEWPTNWCNYLVTLAGNFEFCLFLVEFLYHHYFKAGLRYLKNKTEGFSETKGFGSQSDKKNIEQWFDLADKVFSIFYSGSKDRQKLFRNYIPETSLTTEIVAVMIDEITKFQAKQLSESTIIMSLKEAMHLLQGDWTLIEEASDSGNLTIIVAARGTGVNALGEDCKKVPLEEAQSIIINNQSKQKNFGAITKIAVELTVNQQLMDYLFLSVIGMLPEELKVENFV